MRPFLARRGVGGGEGLTNRVPRVNPGSTRMGPNIRYGHDYSTKHINDRRVVSFNIRSFPKKYNKSRRSEFRKFLSDLAPDTLGLIETNSYWPSIPVEERLYETTFPWFKRRTIEAA